MMSKRIGSYLIEIQWDKEGMWYFDLTTAVEPTRNHHFFSVFKTTTLKDSLVAHNIILGKLWIMWGRIKFRD